jgi:hypothetical protein
MAHSATAAARQAHTPPPSTGVLAPFSFEDLVERIRAEFIEQPGLRLTEAQASRLWRLDRATCERVLCRLTESEFLSRTIDGRFARRSQV